MGCDVSTDTKLHRASYQSLVSSFSNLYIIPLTMTANTNQDLCTGYRELLSRFNDTDAERNETINVCLLSVHSAMQERRD